MAKPIAEAELTKIEEIVRNHPAGISIGGIQRLLESDVPRRTLQYRLRQLVDAERVLPSGAGRNAKYLPPSKGDIDTPTPLGDARGHREADFPISPGSEEIRRYLQSPPHARAPVGYDRGFLDSYAPNTSAYLSAAEREHLATVGQPRISEQPAGTYVKQILNRLLIDLSWNSSRLEGNTYSLLDTRRLIAFGAEAEGRAQFETQMILNHKEAIEFLAGPVQDIGFNRYTILNLHAMLANNLLADDMAAGRLRQIPVGIERSTFHPLETPQLIEECFDQILWTADAIRDPFEQAFFVMVHLPYLQPFDDVNKHVSRLAANIPFIKRNLTPLSFIDVPPDAYTEAILGVYELKQTYLLKDLFLWAYERSAARYAAVQQSLGEPDPFRLKHRTALRTLINEIVRQRMNRKAAVTHIALWAKNNIDAEEREAFRETAESDLLGLHEGNFARYQIRPSEFEAWRSVWNDET